MGSTSTMGTGNLGCFPAHWKALGVSAVAYAAKGIIQSLLMAISKKAHSVLNNGMKAALLQPTTIFLTGRCHISLPPMKNPPPHDAAFPQNCLTTCCNRLDVVSPVRAPGWWCALIHLLILMLCKLIVLLILFFTFFLPYLFTSLLI